MPLRARPTDSRRHDSGKGGSSERPPLLRTQRRGAFMVLTLGVLYLGFVLIQDVRAVRRAELMGTFVEIQVVTRRYRRPERLLDGAEAAMRHVESVCSVYDPDSFVSRLNDLPASTPLRVDPDEALIFDVLETARRVSELSDGAFDITFASVGRYWRFDPEDPRLPTEAEIADALPRVDYRRVVADRATSTVMLRGEGTRIDLGGIAKGTAIDHAARWLASQGIRSALINAGGDLYALGAAAHKKRPWHIALRHPRERGQEVPGVVFELVDRALVTSGDYERSFVIDGQRYHHIIDPRTGLPATGTMSVTVFGPSAELADALATALFVMGTEKGMALVDRMPNVEAIFIDDDMTVRATGDLFGAAESPVFRLTEKGLAPLAPKADSPQSP